MRRLIRTALAALVLPALWAGDAAAQEAALASRCERAAPDPAARIFCLRVAQAVEVLQPQIGMAATGGNPVAGTASTLGMRLGALPRLSVAGRVTGVFGELPRVLDAGTTGDVGVFLPGLNIDAAVGLTSGYSPLPTVGGVGSLDALASIGYLPLPGGKGFDGSPFTWALGLRLGLLRESFTLPGVSLTGMYRQVGDFDFGDPALVRDDAFIDIGIGIWSLRAAVTKQIFAVGLTAGAGYDHYSSDVRFGFVDPGTATRREVRLDDFDNDRWSLFANVSWTILILHIVGELGWQQGGDLVPGLRASDIRFDPGDGRFFGGFAVRLSI